MVPDEGGSEGGRLEVSVDRTLKLCEYAFFPFFDEPEGLPLR